MLELDEDALICDLAETYQIYDYRSLPVRLVATLSAGLRDDSRIKMRMGSIPAPQDIMLLATIADRIEAFRYSFSEDASKGRNRPPSILDALYSVDSQRKGEPRITTPEEFEAALAKFRGD